MLMCEELLPALNTLPLCEPSDGGARVLTHCLYPSADPVFVFVQKLHTGYRVSDEGGALRSALVHGRLWDSYAERASRKHSVQVRGGTLTADAPTNEWLYAAVVAVSNASAMAARLAVEAVVSRAENNLKQFIIESLKSVVSEAKIGSDYEYRGRSGHVWKIDYAVTDERLILIKSVVQNGNSINSNYATFGDVGDEDFVTKMSVYDTPLAQDTNALLRQVATLVPARSLPVMVQREARRRQSA